MKFRFHMPDIGKSIIQSVDVFWLEDVASAYNIKHNKNITATEIECKELSSSQMVNVGDDRYILSAPVVGVIGYCDGHITAKPKDKGIQLDVYDAIYLHVPATLFLWLAIFMIAFLVDGFFWAFYEPIGVCDWFENDRGWAKLAYVCFFISIVIIDFWWKPWSKKEDAK